MAFNFSWIVPDRVAGMALPGREAGAWLKEQGVTAMVSLTVTPARIEGLDLAHIPVVDMTPPTLDQLHAGVAHMREVVEGGGAVVVHCLGGMGRTGTFLAAYLVSEGMTAEAAIERVRELRPGSIETPEQEAAVFAYAELVGGDAQ